MKTLKKGPRVLFFKHFTYIAAVRVKIYINN